MLAKGVLGSHWLLLLILSFDFIPLIQFAMNLNPHNAMIFCIFINANKYVIIFIIINLAATDFFVSFMLCRAIVILSHILKQCAIYSSMPSHVPCISAPLITHIIVWSKLLKSPWE